MANFPQWVLKHKKKGTEIRLIKGHYYLYSITSKWNPQKKRAQKVTIGLLGKITKEDGFVESEKQKLKKQMIITENIPIKEYGISSLIINNFTYYIELLQKYLPNYWKFVLSLSYCRFAYQSPLKNCQYHFAKSYLSERYKNPGLSSGMISKKLRELGQNRHEIVDFCKEFRVKNDNILFDGTDMFSNSKKMSYPQMSKTKKGTFDYIANLMFIFSVKLKIPLYYRILSGDIKDISSFKLCLDEAEINDAVVIADKGFFSESNVDKLENENLTYIIPLKRNSLLIDYSPIQSGDMQKFDGYFMYEKKIIWYYEKKINNRRLIVYKNDDLKAQETNDYLRRCETLPESYTVESFYHKQYNFGTVSFLTNSDDKISVQDLYSYYKSRHQIENMIDGFKNIFEADKSYMQNDDALEGWMFINFIRMHWDYKIIHTLKT